jgi:hypothetical protein
MSRSLQDSGTRRVHNRLDTIKTCEYDQLMFTLYLLVMEKLLPRVTFLQLHETPSGQTLNSMMVSPIKL